MLKRKSEQPRAFTIEVHGEPVKFLMHPFNVRERLGILNDIESLKLHDLNTYETALDTIASVIVSIEGETDTPREVLAELDNFGDIQEIIGGVIKYLGMDADVPNSPSSSAQSTPTAGEAVTKGADVATGPASTIQTQAEPSSCEAKDSQN